MTNAILSAGDIVLVPYYPFTNQFESKRRPALVISASTYNSCAWDVILLAITSNVSRVSQYEVLVPGNDLDFAQTGLKKSSAIKCGAIFAFSHAQIDRRPGVLPVRFLAEVKKILSIILELRSGAAS